MIFKLDSCVDVTAISVETFENFKSKDKHLEKAQKSLYGPDGTYEYDILQYVDSLLDGLPASSKYLADLQEQLLSSSTCS